MIVPVDKKYGFRYITDDSQACDARSAFFLTQLNARYLNDAKAHGCTNIIKAEAVSKILGIENIKIIGITGTNGKTTTAAALYSILLDLGHKVALQGTRGYFINDERVQEKGLTTPTIFETMKNIQDAINEGCEYFIMEVSSHAIVQNRIDGLKFSLKIFTNVTHDHLDYHKSIEEYIAVKSSFFDDETPKLINKDDKKIQYNPKNCRTYGVENPATYKTLAYSLDEGIQVALAKIEKVHECHSPLHGFFNLYNILAAIGAADMLNIAPLDAICEAVENFMGVEGRMEVVSADPLIIVDFAHTPDGMEKVMDSLKEKKIVVVFGAGGDRDRNKRPKMGFIASKFAKKIMITSDNPRSEDPEMIIEEILMGIKQKTNLKVEPDRKKALQEALKWQEKDEVLLILGKGDETYQEIKGQKYPFDDRVIIKNELSSNNTQSAD
ncbi:UDP-N-acetylmuramoyl-L-alanyl-D-glutamate--2,6-diaminopimelate ligase [Sulfurospirillum sp. 1612]|uniref:UDP-N-acetylmuramoyl-L-alanyl-D-glutamate--2, 6-diaminopimelate ligase n=1 Tax=Sulfurospirillum sp. 1612 TaxID=3094835 RepID=UPI002F93E021